MGEVEDQFDLAEQAFQRLLNNNTVEVPDTQQEASTEPNLAVHPVTPEEAFLPEEREAEGTIGESLQQLEDEMADIAPITIERVLDPIEDVQAPECIGGDPVDSTEFFSGVEDALEGVYPGHWGKAYFANTHNSDVIRDNQKAYYISFPEIEITNTKNHRHTIKNLYVFIVFKVNVSGNWVMKERLYGTRLTQSALEHHCRYQHSHLTSTEAGTVTNFCLGGATPTSVAVADLSLNFDLMQFELFLYQISAYVRYESLEGGPYKRMAEMSFSNIHRTRSYNEQSFISRVFTSLELHAIQRNLLFETYTEKTKYGYFPSFNLEKNLPFLEAVKGYADVLDEYIDGKFVQIGSESVEDRYTEENVKQYVRTAFRTTDSEGNLVDMVTNIETIPQKKVEGVATLVPCKYYVERLEAALETAFKYYLNRNQIYEHS